MPGWAGSRTSLRLLVPAEVALPYEPVTLPAVLAVLNCRSSSTTWVFIIQVLVLSAMQCRIRFKLYGVRRTDAGFSMQPRPRVMGF